MTYYLICDPSTGKVVRRSHDPAALNEAHLSTIKVSKKVWKSYRAGDKLTASDAIDKKSMMRWVYRVESRHGGYVP